MAFKFEEVQRKEEEKKIEEEMKKVKVVTDAIARLYLYPSYADVELSQKFYDLVASAKDVHIDKEGNIVIDGKTYLFGVEEEAGYDYYEGVTKSEQRAVKREAKRLYEEFKRREKDELLAFVENSSPDFYVAGIVWIEPEEEKEENEPRLGRWFIGQTPKGRLKKWR